MRITVSVPVVRPLVMAGVAVAFASIASAQQQFVSIAGAPCAAPPVLHCPDADCSSDRVINQGPIVEMKTRRTYFLDYPCDLKAGEKVTFVLSLHGAGSYGNWQRHYFPTIASKPAESAVGASAEARHGAALRVLELQRRPRGRRRRPARERAH